MRTSAGTGPGPLRLPPGEAGRLVGAKHAIYGSTPPKGFQGTGTKAAFASNASDISNLLPQNG